MPSAYKRNELFSDLDESTRRTAVRIASSLIAEGYDEDRAFLIAKDVAIKLAERQKHPMRKSK